MGGEGTVFINRGSCDKSLKKKSLGEGQEEPEEGVFYTGRTQTSTEQRMPQATRMEERGVESILPKESMVQPTS